MRSPTTISASPAATPASESVPKTRERRTARLLLKLTEREKAELHRRARNAKVSMNRYVRDRALEGFS